MSDSDGLFVHGDVYGMEISNGKPENHLGLVDSHMTATPDRVRHARLYWRQRDPADFDPIGTTGRRAIDRTTGVEYMLATHDPFQAEKPEEDSIECFLVHSGWLWFLRPRGVEKDAAGGGLSAATYGGELKQDWARRPVLVDTAGNVVPTRLTKGDKL